MQGQFLKGSAPDGNTPDDCDLVAIGERVFLLIVVIEGVEIAWDEPFVEVEAVDDNEHSAEEVALFARDDGLVELFFGVFRDGEYGGANEENIFLENSAKSIVVFVNKSDDFLWELANSAEEKQGVHSCVYYEASQNLSILRCPRPLPLPK